MNDIPGDRPPVFEILDPVVVECLRKLTPGEKLRQAFKMWDFAMLVMKASIRYDHPDWNDEQIQKEIVRRLRGNFMP